jgi:hypothetical protein
MKLSRPDLQLSSGHPHHLQGFCQWAAEHVVLRSHFLNTPSQEHIVVCKGVIVLPAVREVRMRLNGGAV